MTKTCETCGGPAAHPHLCPVCIPGLRERFVDDVDPAGRERSEVVTPMRTPEFQELRGAATALGNPIIATPQGKVRAYDAPGFTTMLGEREVMSKSMILLMVYNPNMREADEAAIGTGMVVQLPPDSARSIAASLLRLADRIDGGKAN